MFEKKKKEIEEREQSFTKGEFSDEKQIQEKIDDLERKKQFLKNLRKSVKKQARDSLTFNRIDLGIRQMIFLLTNHQNRYKTALYTKRRVDYAQTHDYEPTNHIKTYLSIIKSLERQVKQIPNVMEKSENNVRVKRLIDFEMKMVKDVMDKYITSNGTVNEKAVEEVIEKQKIINKGIEDFRQAKREASKLR